MTQGNMPDLKKLDIEGLRKEVDRLNKSARLFKTVEDVDKIIDLLEAARDHIAHDPKSASIIMAKLQNPVKEGFDSMHNHLHEVSKGQKNLGKALNSQFPLEPLPSDHDAMADQQPLINRAIAMHLLREGQFSMASTFIDEVQSNPDNEPLPASDAIDLDSRMDEAHNEDDVSRGLASFQSLELQVKFAEMHRILQELKARNLKTAIDWARQNSHELVNRGSNLEFELSKLQFVWLFKGPSVNGLPDDDENGKMGALAYARKDFVRFQGRHLGEITRLAASMAYEQNLADSPYLNIFAIDSAFGDVATSFTREFCSLLGLSSESPLYLAATAGAHSLPYLLKYTQASRAKGTEWSTRDELAFPTPLPAGMLFHSIFVCPVSKEQSTEANPPMIIPCGHVLAKDTLKNLAKGSRFKCPYCPFEGNIRDARQIIL